MYIPQDGLPAGASAAAFRDFAEIVFREQSARNTSCLSPKKEVNFIPYEGPIKNESRRRARLLKREIQAANQGVVNHIWGP